MGEGKGGRGGGGRKVEEKDEEGEEEGVGGGGRAAEGDVGEGGKDIAIRDAGRRKCNWIQ